MVSFQAFQQAQTVASVGNKGVLVFLIVMSVLGVCWLFYHWKNRKVALAKT